MPINEDDILRIEDGLTQLAQRRARELLRHFSSVQRVTVRTDLIEMDFLVVKGDDETRLHRGTAISLQLMSTSRPRFLKSPL